MKPSPKPRRRGSIYRNWRYLFNAVAVLYDTAIVFFCGLMTSIFLGLFYNGPVLGTLPTIYIVTFFWIIFLLASMMLGLYRVSFYIDVNYQFVIAAKAYLVSCAIIFGLFYIRAVMIPRSFTLLFLFLLPILYFIGRNILIGINLTLRHWGLGLHNVLMVVDERVQIDDFYRFSWLHDMGYHVHGMIADQSNGRFERLNVPVYPRSKMVAAIREHDIDRVFIPTTEFVVPGLDEILSICREYQVKLKILAPRAIRLLQFAHIYDLAGFTLYTPPGFRIIHSMNGFAKRLFDILTTLVLLLILSPILLLTALIILLESGRPIIYKQRRASVRGGREFFFYKFRSMVQNADEMKADLRDANESTGLLFKMKDDPRVTRFGRFIRRFSIDELPQLFNVLKGDMSLVGPRPLPLNDLEEERVESGFWTAIRDRGAIKPGITGLWQISGRSDLTFDEMVLLDLYYFEYQSFFFDLEILMETLRVVLFPKGAY